jgi:hypothetical protein
LDAVLSLFGELWKISEKCVIDSNTYSPARQAGPTGRFENGQSFQTSLERRTSRSANSRAKKWPNFREKGLLAFSISQTALDFRELGQSIFWKNFAQIENNTENAGVFANVEKIFWDEAENNFLWVPKS